MRFKNYRNPYTDDNIIYSFNDLYDMPLGEFIRKKYEVLNQYRVLGVPREEELKSSENVVHVEAYTRNDGTEVKAHYRSKAYAGSASDVKTEESIQEKQETQIDKNIQKRNQDKTEQTEQSEKENDERLYPKEIAGTKRGEPMSFEEADGGKVNPNYDSTTYDNDQDKYYNNCQSCIVAYEARRRGYDVEVAPFVSEDKTGELSNTLFEAWIDPDSNEICEVGTEIDVMGGEDCYQTLEKEIKQGERYALIDAHFVERDGEEKSVDAHVRIVERDNNGNLIMYDPQDGGIRKDDDMKEYISKWMGPEAQLKPQYLRIDNKIFNPYYINDVVKQKNK